MLWDLKARENIVYQLALTELTKNAPLIPGVEMNGTNKPS